MLLCLYNFTDGGLIKYNRYKRQIDNQQTYRHPLRCYQFKLQGVPDYKGTNLRSWGQWSSKLNYSWMFLFFLDREGRSYIFFQVTISVCGPHLGDFLFPMDTCWRHGSPSLERVPINHILENFANREMDGNKKLLLRTHDRFSWQ